MSAAQVTGTADPGRILRLTAAIESVTLLLLVLNLVTVHVAAIGSAIGPVHGAAYVTTLICAWLLRHRAIGIIWWALIPGIGGLLAVRSLTRTASAGPR
jgi:hypothetical protein